ncbi:MAG: hypothetical protein ACRERU_11110, partial [Methylococcales bacterium]
TNLSLNGRYSWGGTNTANNTTTLSSGITLERPDFNTNSAYGFYPVFYLTQDGTVKVAHAVDVLGSFMGQFFWTDLYSTDPDAALNLPSRFCPLYDSSTNFLVGWEPNLAPTRNLIRGFFATDPNQSPITNDYQELSGPATAGDPVRLAVRVYNYSTFETIPASTLTVQFSAVKYNINLDKEDPTRTVLGEMTLTGAIPPQGMATAEYAWDTTGFGPNTPGTQLYRIYVDLDPLDAITETYETDSIGGASCADPTNRSNPPITCNPGQNNEGWGLVSVITPSISPAPAAEPTPEADISLGEDSFAALGKNGKLRTRKVTAKLNETVRLRVAVHSDQDQPLYRWLYVYDGEPGEGPTIAMQRLHGLERNRNQYVWIDFRPRSLGQHDLHAVVLERGADPVQGNNVAMLQVNVTKSPKPRKTKG